MHSSSSCPVPTTKSSTSLPSIDKGILAMAMTDSDWSRSIFGVSMSSSNVTSSRKCREASWTSWNIPYSSMLSCRSAATQKQRCPRAWAIFRGSECMGTVCTCRRCTLSIVPIVKPSSVASAMQFGKLSAWKGHITCTSPLFTFAQRSLVSSPLRTQGLSQAANTATSPLPARNSLRSRGCTPSRSRLPGRSVSPASPSEEVLARVQEKSCPSPRATSRCTTLPSREIKILRACTSPPMCSACTSSKRSRERILTQNSSQVPKATTLLPPPPWPSSTSMTSSPSSGMTPMPMQLTSCWSVRCPLPTSFPSSPTSRCITSPPSSETTTPSE
mmetsp:Transcript_9372/g.35094  ORF Transcript_9372/g.35094 Transcript_9372/m.35094 type:complete len:330 (+) Transcript_9372:1317-2306(+)